MKIHFRAKVKSSCTQVKEAFSVGKEWPEGFTGWANELEGKVASCSYVE